jgi:hypothetical protein
MSKEKLKFGVKNGDGLYALPIFYNPSAYDLAAQEEILADILHNDLIKYEKQGYVSSPEKFISHQRVQNRMGDVVLGNLPTRDGETLISRATKLKDKSEDLVN